MSANDLLAIIGITLGAIAWLGIAVVLWSACARGGQIDDDHDMD